MSLPPTGDTNLLIIAKEPLPGKVKTRLSPPYSPAEAARLAAAALSDTLRMALRVPARRRVLVLDGVAGDWLPPGIEVLPQHGSGLDERITDAFDSVAAPSLLIGMDTPQLTPDDVLPALAPDAWNGCDAWFGAAADGGFWALGLSAPCRDLVLGVPMSRSDTGRIQRQRLVAAGLTVRELPPLRDVDTADDVNEVAALAPGSDFAATARSIRGERT